MLHHREAPVQARHSGLLLHQLEFRPHWAVLGNEQRRSPASHPTVLLPLSSLVPPRQDHSCQRNLTKNVSFIHIEFKSLTNSVGCIVCIDTLSHRNIPSRLQYETAKETDVYSSLLDSVGEDEGGMIWESDIETCTLSYVK